RPPREHDRAADRARDHPRNLARRVLRIQDAEVVKQSSSQAFRYRYILGDAAGERERLRVQARLWDPVAHALFDRVGVRRGWNVLEIGPGHGSLHLELRKRVRGPVDAVERSAAFAANLHALCLKDRLGEGRWWQEDL